jgi:histone deacetylase 6
VLYTSLHRHDEGTFYPNSDEAEATHLGVGAGRGFTVNVPWNTEATFIDPSVIGDGDYK